MGLSFCVTIFIFPGLERSSSARLLAPFWDSNTRLCSRVPCRHLILSRHLPSIPTTKVRARRSELIRLVKETRSRLTGDTETLLPPTKTMYPKRWTTVEATMWSGRSELIHLVRGTHPRLIRDSETLPPKKLVYLG